MPVMLHRTSENRQTGHYFQNKAHECLSFRSGRSCRDGRCVVRAGQGLPEDQIRPGGVQTGSFFLRFRSLNIPVSDYRFQNQRRMRRHGHAQRLSSAVIASAAMTRTFCGCNSAHLAVNQAMRVSICVQCTVC